MVLMANPANRSVTTFVLPTDRAREYTSAIVAADPAKASNAVALKPKTDHWEKKKIPMQAPKIAPPERSGDVGVGDGIAKEALKEKTSEGQRRTHQPRGQYPREPNVKQDEPLRLVQRMISEDGG